MKKKSFLTIIILILLIVLSSCNNKFEKNLEPDVFSEDTFKTKATEKIEQTEKKETANLEDYAPEIEGEWKLVSGGLKEGSDVEETILLESEELILKVKSFHRHGDEGPYLLMEVENLTEDELELGVINASISGIHIFPKFHLTVAAKQTVEERFLLGENQLKSANITSFSEISFYISYLYKDQDRQEKIKSSSVISIFPEAEMEYYYSVSEDQLIGDNGYFFAYLDGFKPGQDGNPSVVRLSFTSGAEEYGFKLKDIKINGHAMEGNPKHEVIPGSYSIIPIIIEDKFLKDNNLEQVENISFKIDTYDILEPDNLLDESEELTVTINEAISQLESDREIVEVKFGDAAYDANGLKMTFMSLEDLDYFGPVLKLEVENNNDAEYIFSVEQSTVNNTKSFFVALQNIEPNATTEVEIVTDQYDLKANEVDSMKFTFSIKDQDFETVEEVRFPQFYISAEGRAEVPDLTEQAIKDSDSSSNGTLIFDDQDLKIYIQPLISTSLTKITDLVIENNSTEGIEILTYKYELDGEEQSLGIYEELEPQTRTIYPLSLTDKEKVDEMKIAIVANYKDMPGVKTLTDEYIFKFEPKE
ncbi:MAG: hypothetical protein ACOX2H_01175 [Saccharofermentanales bacterium]